jgi:hypothetical protein
MALTKVLIAVKTYPAISKKYDELVCTAGFREDGSLSKLLIEDWETGQLFWNCLRRNEGNEIKACEEVKKKYLYDFAKTKDLYLFLGTTQIYHFTSKNPFVIIGTFHPKAVTQLKIF